MNAKKVIEFQNDENNDPFNQTIEKKIYNKLNQDSENLQTTDHLFHPQKKDIQSISSILKDQTFQKTSENQGNAKSIKINYNRITPFHTQNYTGQNINNQNLGGNQQPINDQQFNQSFQRISYNESIVNSLQCSQIIEEKVGKKSLISIKEGVSHVVDQKVYQGQRRIVSEVPDFSNRNIIRPSVQRIQQQKFIELIKEKPVQVQRIVDVPYDVVIDVPIERVIEKEKITEVIIEKPIEKIVEVPIEQIIERQVEKLIEIPVPVKKYIERPYQKIVQVPQENVRQNLIYQEKYIDCDESQVNDFRNQQIDQILDTRVSYMQTDKIIETPIYYENYIEKTLLQPKQTLVEIPKEKLTYKKVPYQIDRPIPVEKIIEKIIEVPIEVPVYKEIPIIREVPIYIENIIEKYIPIEKIIEKEIEIPIEHIIEKPVYIDNMIEKKIEKIVEVPIPINQYIETPIEIYNEVPINVEKYLIKPIEKIIKRQCSQIIQQQIQQEEIQIVHKFEEKQINLPINVNRYLIQPTEEIIERPFFITNTVEKAKFIEKDIPFQITNEVENIILINKESERQVHIDIEIEKRVEQIVEKIIEVPVEVIIEVPINVYIEKPIYEEILIKEEVECVITQPELIMEEYDESDEFTDDVLQKMIYNQEEGLIKSQKEYDQLYSQLQSYSNEFNLLRQQVNSCEFEENIKLLARIEQLEQETKNQQKKQQFLQSKKMNKIHAVEQVIVQDEKVISLINRIKNLTEENNRLVMAIEDKGERVRNSVISSIK